MTGHDLRPLPVHLTQVLAATQGSLAALFNPDPHIWHAGLQDEAADLSRRILAAGRVTVANHLAQQLVHEMEGFAAGLRRYRAHPWHHRPSPHEVVHQIGSVRLRRYGSGPPVLLIPSLVNGSEVLDLLPDRSCVRALMAAGLGVASIDWGTPGAQECALSVDAYVTERLIPLIERLAERAGRPVALTGYCMGGLLALAAACLRPDLVSALALLAMPWEFAAAGPLRWLSRTITSPGDTQPVAAERVQALFVSLDPTLTLRKFIRFGQLEEGDPEMERFVAVEAWSNEGPPLAAPAAAQVADQWYRDNVPGRGLWQIAGTRIEPAAVARPRLFALPANDRIVPLPCAEPAVVAQAAVLRPEAGHVGMMVGRRAQAQLFTPLAQWLLDSPG
ncbi:MAG: alpha/beta fold hydrolase [Rhodothalassiaceae bacterium]